MTEQGSNLAQWKAAAVQTVDLPDGRTITYNLLDPLAVAAATGDLNPLMQVFTALQESGDGVDVMTKNPGSLPAVVKLAREVCIQAVIDPPLTEAGHKPDESVSVDVIPLSVKIEIFMNMIGGSVAIDAANAFPKETD